MNRVDGRVWAGFTEGNNNRPAARQAASPAQPIFTGSNLATSSRALPSQDGTGNAEVCTPANQDSGVILPSRSVAKQRTMDVPPMTAAI